MLLFLLLNMRALRSTVGFDATDADAVSIDCTVSDVGAVDNGVVRSCACSCPRTCPEIDNPDIPANISVV